MHNLCSSQLNKGIARQCVAYHIYGAAQFQAALFHQKSNTFVAFFFSPKSFQSLDDEEKSSIPWLTWELRQTHHLIQSNGFVLVPSLVFSPEHIETYASQAGLGEGKPTFDQLNHSECFVVFNEQEETVSSPTHFQSRLADYLGRYVSPRCREFIYFHIQHENLLIGSFSKEKLLFFNEFKVHSKEDVLYFLACAARVLKKNLSEANVFFSGKIAEKSPFQELLNRHIGEIEPIWLDEGIRFDRAINPYHQLIYRDVFTLPLCGL